MSAWTYDDTDIHMIVPDCICGLNRFLEFEYANGRLRYANNSK